jgi:hypothetical protein
MPFRFSSPLSARRSTSPGAPCSAAYAAPVLGVLHDAGELWSHTSRNRWHLGIIEDLSGRTDLSGLGFLFREEYITIPTFELGPTLSSLSTMLDALRERSVPYEAMATPSMPVCYASIFCRMSIISKVELPLLLSFISDFDEPIEGILIDGYVWLDANDLPGLGGHLFSSLGRCIPLIGIAKTRYRNDTWSIPVLRGESRRCSSKKSCRMCLSHAWRLPHPNDPEACRPCCSRRISTT